MILLIDTDKLTLKRKIATELNIRRLNYFEHQEQSFLILMPYENYIMLYELKSGKYCKLIGHRSFIAHAIYNKEHQMIVTAGMDHRISLVRMNVLKENHWIKAKVSK